MTANEVIVKEIAEIYSWLDAEIGKNSKQTDNCEACGKCCDFDTFGHRLFITTPEIIYLKEKLAPLSLKKMTGGICPYNEKGKCTIYESRFTGCRIFNCRGDADFQSELTEAVLTKVKSLCDEFNIPYIYTDLKTALNTM